MGSTIVSYVINGLGVIRLTMRASLLRGSIVVVRFR